MVKTRSQTAKTQQKVDVQNTKRSRGGSGGGGGNDIDEVKFRELLAAVFPSSFANEQVENAKKARRASKKRRSTNNTKVSGGVGKRRKISKVEENSDASSSASYEDDQHTDTSSSDEEITSNIDFPSMTGGNGKKKVFAFTAVNGRLRPVKKGESPMKAMKKHMFEEKYGKNSQDCEDSSSDYCPEEEDDDIETLTLSDDNETVQETESDNSGSESDALTEELECEDETFEEMFGNKDKDPEEDSDYEDSDDDNDNDYRNKNVKQSSSQCETSTQAIDFSSADDEFNSKISKAPKDFQRRCRNLWVEFKNKMENERKLFIAKGKKAEKKQRRSNLTSFRKMLREGDVMNDLRYFNRFMSVDEQQNALAEMEKVKAFSRVDKPYRLRLLDAPIPPQIKAVALKKINALRYTSPGDGEYNKLKKWVDAFLQIPFGKHSQLELSLIDGQDKCHSFMENAQRILDEAVYGLDDVKLQVIQMLGQWISNPNAVGSAMAIHGPMGTGKTTLVKEGISRILGREFIFIALGGATDSSFLEGHSYTYEGSTWGKIVDLLMQCQTMNPIIYFDELDKVSDTPRGEEIIGILTHLTDTSQNDRFHDKYFSEIEFDLSKCMFFFSYNDPERVNPILRDRMYTIKTNGYSPTEKVTIAEKHLIPKLLPQVGFTTDEITFPKETLEYITREYTSDDEKGVRSLKRRLEIICTKLNLYRLLKPGTTMFGQKIPDIVNFPMNITPELVQELLRKEKKDNNHWVMYT